MQFIAFHALYIICSLSTAVMYGVLAYKFRLRKDMAADYGDSKVDYEIANVETEELREWQYGMELPPMPVENHKLGEIYPSEP